MSDVLVQVDEPMQVIAIVNDAGVPGPPGPAGPAGSGGQSWVSAAASETPDGVRRTFTTPSAYLPGDLIVYLNGLRESYVSQDGPTSFTFSEAPISGDQITLLYRTS